MSIPEQPVLAYIFTTFPKSTETFIQREVSGLLANGLRPRLYSMHGGGGTFEGLPVNTFPKWKLLALLWTLPPAVLRRPGVFAQMIRGVLTRRAPSWLNFWENMLGAAFAVVHARHFRRLHPAHIHAVWGGGPSTAAWLLWRLDGHPYSAAGHAYDLYRDGGDWWLAEKLQPALFVHTSTDMGRQTLLARGIQQKRIHLIRRGLTTLPPLKSLRPAPRLPLRLLCVARLVPKKGLDHQLRIYAALRDAGVAFEARIAGEGPLHASLTGQVAALGLTAHVTLLGHLPQAGIAALLEWADVMLHTGVIAADGDRDGLPNVIPEAMSAGVLVVTSPAAATTEAIAHEQTGLVAPPEDTAAWVTALRRLATDDALAHPLRANARAWVELHFDARQNAARLATLYRDCGLG
ncbi:glycosyltransferase family 4 protein [Geminisphaera colitermitum]|uniref:glycosyltransferase family 4 protein n=1 Tax=Geminisphaera colitermitum TaxID=1148786 RepID=UPI000158CD0B|nr:glycosyltransferase family 4 protein [Geminisphaera colitermitum]